MRVKIDSSSDRRSYASK